MNRPWVLTPLMITWGVKSDRFTVWDLPIANTTSNYYKKTYFIRFPSIGRLRRPTRQIFAVFNLSWFLLWERNDPQQKETFYGVSECWCNAVILPKFKALGCLLLLFKIFNELYIWWRLAFYFMNFIHTFSQLWTNITTRYFCAEIERIWSEDLLK